MLERLRQLWLLLPSISPGEVDGDNYDCDRDLFHMNPSSGEETLPMPTLFSRMRAPFLTLQITTGITNDNDDDDD